MTGPHAGLFWPAAIASAPDVPLAVARAVWWHAAAGVIAGRTAAGRATATDLLDALAGTFAGLATAADGRHTPGGRGVRSGGLPWDRWLEALP